MEELIDYLNYQKQHLKKWSKNKTLNEFGKGKLDAFDNVLKQLTIYGVVKRLKSKEEISFEYWLEINKIKQIGNTKVYKKGHKNYYLKELLKKHKELLTF